jgi:hypothetical protein
MGSIGQSLFGGSRSKSVSKNLNNDQITGALGSTMGATGGATSALQAMLGIGGDPAAQTGALNNFANSAGMNWLRDQGQTGIMGNMAAKGLMQSGAAMKSLDKFNSGLASTYLNDYMSQLGNVGNLGLGAANAISGAGQFNKSKASEKPGMGKFLGSVISGMPAG